MPIQRTVFAVLSTAVLIAVPCSAQNMKPGLWEISNKMQSGNGQLEQAMQMMHEHMAKMTPEQRKSMHDMMETNGLQMPTAGANGAMSLKMCMTPEMVAGNQIPMQQGGNCTHQRSPVIGKKMKVAFTCTQPAASGEGQVTFNSDTAYTMKMNVTTSATGKPETMRMDASGRWLGANCGTVKPFTMPKAR